MIKKWARSTFLFNFLFRSHSFCSFFSIVKKLISFVLKSYRSFYNPSISFVFSLNNCSVKSFVQKIVISVKKLSLTFSD